MNANPEAREQAMYTITAIGEEITSKMFADSFALTVVDWQGQHFEILIGVRGLAAVGGEKDAAELLAELIAAAESRNISS